MTKVAVDVALIPPEWVMDKAIEINKRMVEEYNGVLKLGKADFLPHLTLAMGVMDETDLENVAVKLAEITKHFNPLELRVTGIRNDEVHNCALFEIAKTPQLQKLHLEIMASLAPFFSYEVSNDYIYGGDATQSSLNYCADFTKCYSFENYHPHITLGKGKGGEVGSFEFTASDLAIYHMGRNNTCRKVLHSVELKQKLL
ncbi:MAG: 2'-5' RNA ligase family protein [Candidatus Micrarchaeota archaeon]|nr:2'-5' RNA ligase family protein [Candidatus Micrarchaeota archaeon]